MLCLLSPEFSPFLHSTPLLSSHVHATRACVSMTCRPNLNKVHTATTRKCCLLHTPGAAPACFRLALYTCKCSPTCATTTSKQGQAATTGKPAVSIFFSSSTLSDPHRDYSHLPCPMTSAPAMTTPCDNPSVLQSVPFSFFFLSSSLLPCFLMHKLQNKHAHHI